VPSTSETLQWRGSSWTSVRTKPIGLNQMLIPKTLPFAPAVAGNHLQVEDT
jgi:hypothetical protein